VPDELRGRIMSLYVLLFIGSTPIGAFLTGTLATAIGVQAALAIEAGVCIIGLAIALVYYRTHIARTQPS